MADAHDTVDEGDYIPDVELIAPTGEEVKLSELVDHGPLVIAFYPKDFTPICRLEARRFRDAYERFKQLDAEVIGISSDPPESHRAFSQKDGIPFTLYTDPNGSVRKTFGVPRTLGIIPGRVTYVVDADGRVRNIYSAQLAAGKHVTESLEAIQRMREDRDSGPSM